MSFWEWVWAFANSPVGVAIVLSITGAIAAKVFTAIPSWERVYNANKGVFFDAVRFAEKAIPDDTPNAAAQRADAAFKFILQFAPHLETAKEADLKRAINEAHDEIK